MPKQFTLGKNERLKSRKQIERLFAEGKSFIVNPFRVHFIVNGEASLRAERSKSMVNSSLQFGVGVSAKNFKRAVDRNRIKRLTREAWRLQKKELKELPKASNKQLNVFFIYTGKEVPEYKLIVEKVSVVIQKLIKAIEQTGKS